MKMNDAVLAGLTLAAAAAMTGRAGVPVFDFEDDAQIALWRIRSNGQDTLERSPQFATSGESSMLFKTPAWKEGLEQWPAFEAKPPLADWAPYDRLVIDITNPNGESPFLSLFISDSKIPFRHGLRYSFRLPENGFQRYIIPLSFPPGIDRRDIGILHFFSQRPSAPMSLHLDNIALLKKGETLADPGSTFVRQLAELTLAAAGPPDRISAECRQALDAALTAPALLAHANAELLGIETRIASLRREMAAPDLTLARLAELRQELDLLPRKAVRRMSELRFRQAYSELGLPDSGMAIGFASSMVKILPRDMPFELSVSKTVEISLARNEKESFQVAVLPLADALAKVRVEVTDLKTDTGVWLGRDHIDCDVVGYVRTETHPPYTVPYVGWWPDPILDFLDPVDIAAGDLQTFWVRIRAPKTQASGVYRGTLTVAADGVEPVAFGLTVRVYSFAMPDCTPLPTAITFFERKKQMGGEPNWQTMKLKYADFLADYYIDYDSLYRRDAPDFEVLTHLHEQGRLVAFNLGNVFNAGTQAEGFEQAIAKTVERLRPAYETAKKIGLLDHAYIYGFDERPKEQFGLLERSAQALRNAFPEVPLMTTSYDHSFGLESEVKTIDAWCPLTPKFDSDRAGRARAVGKWVWWYICCGPRNPYANWFVEYAAIESRLLMGAMTAKYRPDGFLYYSLTIWNRNKPITTGPFTDWNPVSWTTYHGDGSLLCSGPGGKPVPTIRLENYRDGLEDYAYACILEELVRQHEARKDALSADQRAWLAEARAALPVPETLVKDMREYSHSSDDVYAYRNRLGALIDRADSADISPWNENFSVRGFRREAD